MARVVIDANVMISAAFGGKPLEAVAKEQPYNFLVEEGVVTKLVETSVRFAIGKSGVSTALLGISSQDQLGEAAKYVERGPLPSDTLGRIRVTWSGPG